MKQKEKIEYEALNTVQDRAKWLLEKGVTSRVTISNQLGLVAVPVAAGIVLPGEYSSESEAIIGGVDWLTKKAGLDANAEQLFVERPSNWDY